MSETKLRQQTNSQAQAGAASQVIVNIFFVTTNGLQWTVKPIAFHVDRDRVRRSDEEGVPSESSEIDLDVKANKTSNAQGQGLHVLNDFAFLDLLQEAVRAAAQDQDIQKALDEGR